MSGRHGDLIPRAARAAAGEGTHFASSRAVSSGEVENEDWASALVEFARGVVGTIEASRVIVGPHVRMRFDVNGDARARWAGTSSG